MSCENPASVRAAGAIRSAASVAPRSRTHHVHRHLGAEERSHTVRYRIAIFVHCQTTLVGTFRELFPELGYCQNRAIVLDPAEPLPVHPLRACIEMALTYKLRKKKRRRGQRPTAVGGGAP